MPIDRIEFTYSAHDLAFATSVRTYPHGLFAGFWHGEIVDCTGQRIARTASAYPSQTDALRAAARGLTENVIHART